MIGTATGKALGIWLGVEPPIALALAALPAVAVFAWLQAGQATQMVARAFKLAPDKVAPAS